KGTPFQSVPPVLNCLGKASCRAAVTNRRLSPEKSCSRKRDAVHRCHLLRSPRTPFRYSFRMPKTGENWTHTFCEQKRFLAAHRLRCHLPPGTNGIFRCDKVLILMPQSVSHLRVVLASPGDVTAERKAFAGLVEQINRDTGRAAGIELELWSWETDAKPGFHLMGPQGLIDNVLRIEDCDLFVGIFWNRIGTPTADGKTGTEHEFSTAFISW